MTRAEIIKKFDELLDTFNPKDCGVADFELDDNEYNNIVNTVWQLKCGVKEEDVIKPSQLLGKIHSNDVREICIAKLLRGLLNKCGLHNFYFSNENRQ